MAALLNERWGLTGVAVVERLQTYPTRFVERIGSDQGSFAVKVDTAPGALAQGSEDVQAYLADALPRHVPAVVPDRTGALRVFDQGRRITLLEDIAGEHPVSVASTWRGLGEVLAYLHELETPARTFAIPVRTAADELELLADAYPYAEEFRALTDRVRRIAEHPAATIHGEVNLANARRRPNGDLALLDWDAAGTGPVAVDLGYPLICVLHDEDLVWHEDQAVAFYRGYRDAGGTGELLPEQVLDAAVMHAMRYLRYGNTVKRWQRLKHVLRNEPDLIAFLGRVLRE